MGDVLHVPNYHPVMLQQSWYTYWHNNVLSEMFSHLDKMLVESPECKLFADLEGRHSLCGNTIPSSILPTTSKPDILIVDHSCKLIIVAELTIPFETNISKSHDYKTNKDSHLICDIVRQVYNCYKFLVIEIGSLGYISIGSPCSPFPWITKEWNQKSNHKILRNGHITFIFFSKYPTTWIDSTAE